MRDKVKWDKRFLKLAEHVSTWSKDPSTQVGAVITDDNRVVSLGYNGFPSGIEDDWRLENREEKYKIIVHGEVNAILFANRSLEGCTLYTYPFMPCSVCAGKVIQSGIKQVITYHDNNPRWVDSFKLTKEMFNEAGIKLLEYTREKE